MVIRGLHVGPGWLGLPPSGAEPSDRRKHPPWRRRRVSSRERGPGDRRQGPCRALCRNHRRDALSLVAVAGRVESMNPRISALNGRSRAEDPMDHCRDLQCPAPRASRAVRHAIPCRGSKIPSSIPGLARTGRAVGLIGGGRHIVLSTATDREMSVGRHAWAGWPGIGATRHAVPLRPDRPRLDGDTPARSGMERVREAMGGMCAGWPTAAEPGLRRGRTSSDGTDRPSSRRRQIRASPGRCGRFHRPGMLNSGEPSMKAKDEVGGGRAAPGGGRAHAPCGSFPPDRGGRAPRWDALGREKRQRGRLTGGSVAV